MIVSIHSKPLKLLYDKGDVSKLPADHLRRINTILSALDVAKHPEAMNTPGADFHQLKGDKKGYYSVKVKANWKVIFRFEGEDVIDVDYVDYH